MNDTTRGTVRRPRPRLTLRERQLRTALEIAEATILRLTHDNPASRDSVKGTLDLIAKVLASVNAGGAQ